MDKWKITHNSYLADKINPKLRLAYWEGHRDFAYDLVNFVKPKRIVELGSQYGCSLFTFCQSVLENHLDTEINAVDFWSGDIEAEDSGEDVFKIVKKTVDEYFKNLHVSLFQMSFDQAVDKFENESIDLLHIDGFHTFDAVDHDFKTWLPKLKKDGIILFHDVYSPIDQGSCDHWAHIKEEYDKWFEFKHSCGLGILFPKGDAWYNKIQNTDFEERCHDLYYYRALYEYTDIRFKELSENYKKRYEAICNQSKMIDERDATIKSQAKLIDDKDNAIKSQTELINERDATIESQTKLINERDATIESQTKLIDDKDDAIRSQTELINERDTTIKNQTQMIDERDATIQEQDRLINQKNAIIKNYTDEEAHWKHLGKRVMVRK